MTTLPPTQSQTPNQTQRPGRLRRTVAALLLGSTVLTAPALAGWAAVAGTVNQKIEPFSGADSMPIWPPMVSTRRLEMASPRPDPPNLRA